MRITGMNAFEVGFWFTLGVYVAAEISKRCFVLFDIAATWV